MRKSYHDPTTHPKRIPFEYTKITEEIFIGTNQCCRTHFDEELVSKGVTADISLEEKQMDHPAGVKFYLWLPVQDDFAPQKEQFDLGVAALEQFVNNKIKVYIHCKNGHGRAPTLVAAYLVKSQGMKPQAAVDFLKSRRPVVHLTDAQFRALEEYAERISQ